MTTVENNAGKSGATNHISPADLIRLHELGFKIVPLDEHGKPAMPWTENYENPEYWTLEKITQESYKFKNVATTFGKTHLKDEPGRPLYLCGLDIDSNEVYKILFRLKNGNSSEYSLFPLVQKCTFVVKTRKPNGFHIYWLSHKQHNQINIIDCTEGSGFEIKTGKAMLTLPPSTHREDLGFQYKNYGQAKVWISDEFYGKLIETLSVCLKPKSEHQVQYYKQPQSQQVIELDDSDNKTIHEALCPHYKKGSRSYLVLALCGLLRRWNVSKESVIDLIQILAKDDEERRSRIETLERTYKMEPEKVAGVKFFQNTIGVDASKDVLHAIFNIIRGKKEGDLISRLANAVVSEYVFVTTTDNEDIYWYDDEKGVYLAGQQWRIDELCQVIYPKLRTHELNEVISQIKRRTYTDRSKFDVDPDILNLTNGLLNMRTKVLSPHTPEYLGTVQLPREYKPKTVCPKILQFLKMVLRPKDIHIMLQVIGYCLYRSCEYDKAIMFFGTGANGKGVLIRLIEEFLGGNNCSHRSLQDLDRNRFAVADLHSKLANTFADLKSLRLSETGNFKMLVSGDPITGEHKFQNPFSFRNMSKLIFSANEIPESDDKTDAFYRRWLIFHFDKKFVGGKEDTKLLDKLTTPEELSGLLNLALIGHKQLFHEGGFHDKDVEDLRKDYEEHTNDVNAFLYQECIVDITNPEYSTLATDVYAAYVTFCVRRGTRPKDMAVFGKKLAAQGIYNVRHQDYGPREAYYDGLKLLKDIRGLNQALD